jgi:hypothetical protein
MDPKDIVAALAENNLDLARERVTQALSERAVEALKVRKVEIANNYFAPRK